MRDGNPLKVHRDVASAIRQVRIMERFFAEVATEENIGAKIYDDLRLGYAALLNEELAPVAYQLAFALMQLEDADPAITRAEAPRN